MNRFKPTASRHSSSESTNDISASRASMGNCSRDDAPKPGRSRACTVRWVARALRFRAHRPTPDPMPCSMTSGMWGAGLVAGEAGPLMGAGLAMRRSIVTVRRRIWPPATRTKRQWTSPATSGGSNSDHHQQLNTSLSYTETIWCVFTVHELTKLLISSIGRQAC